MHEGTALVVHSTGSLHHQGGESHAEVRLDGDHADASSVVQIQGGAGVDALLLLVTVLVTDGHGALEALTADSSRELLMAMLHGAAGGNVMLRSGAYSTSSSICNNDATHCHAWFTACTLVLAQLGGVAPAVLVAVLAAQPDVTARLVNGCDAPDTEALQVRAGCLRAPVAVLTLVRTLLQTNLLSIAASVAQLALSRDKPEEAESVCSDLLLSDSLSGFLQSACGMGLVNAVLDLVAMLLQLGPAYAETVVSDGLPAFLMYCTAPPSHRAECVSQPFAPAPSSNSAMSAKADAAPSVTR